MANLVYFDQQVIQKDFASFTSTDLLSNKSILSSLFSLVFKSDDSSWNSAFSYACDASGSLAALVVSKYLYTIDLFHNRINYLFIDTINSRSSVSINSKYVAILYNSTTVQLIPRESTHQEQTINLPSKSVSILCLGEIIYALTKNGHLLNVETNESILQDLPIGRSFFHISSSQNIAIVGKNTLYIITDELTTITPKQSLIEPQDSTFSANGRYLFVLDKIYDPGSKEISDTSLNLLVFDSQQGFELIDTIEFPQPNGYLSSWDKTHVVIYDLGSFYFVSIDTHQIQTHSIKPQSVLRGTKDGLLMFEFEDQNGDSFHFNLLRYTAVTPLELYERNCEKGYLGDALNLMRMFDFDKDTYYKASIGQSPLTVKLIDDELTKVSDKDWVYNFCISTEAPTSEIARKLILFGLQIRPNDPLLAKQKERLHIYNIMKSAFKSKDWKEFRDCDIKEKVMKMAKQSLFQKVAVIFEYSSEIDENMKHEIISQISLFIEPQKYVSVMPKTAQVFRERAKNIDEVCGQSYLLKQLMQLGSLEIPELRLDYELTTEFDVYVSELASMTKNDLFDVDISMYMKYNDYFELNDDQRLLLFLKNSKTGVEFNNKLNTYGTSILKRSPSSLEFVLNEAFSKLEDSLVFPNMPINDRIYQIQTVLHKQPKKFAIRFVENVITHFAFEFTSTITNSFRTNWASYIKSKDLNDFLNFARYSTLYYKAITYFPVDKLDPSLIISIATRLIKQKIQKEWKEFYSLVTSFKCVKENKNLQNKLYGLNIMSLIEMQIFEDDLEISNANDRDVAIDVFKELILSAKSCDINDPIISGVNNYISLIPISLYDDAVKSLKLNISLYQRMYAIDPSTTPKQVQESENLNDLIVSCIESQKFTDFDQLKTYVQVVLDTKPLITNIDEMKISTALSRLCLKYGRENNNAISIEYGSVFLSKSSDEIKIEYLNENLWNNQQKKEAICDERIRNSESLNPFFVQYKSDYFTKQKFGNANLTNNSILDFILNLKIQNDDFNFLNFCFDFVRKSDLSFETIFQEYFDYRQNIIEFSEVINKLSRANLPPLEIDELRMLNERIQSENKDIDSQYEKLINVEKNGVVISQDVKCKIITFKSLKDFGINIDNTNLEENFDIKTVLKLIFEKQIKVESPQNNMFELIKLWYDSSLFTQFDGITIIRMVSLIPSNKIVPNRPFITEILKKDENNELAVFNLNHNLIFAASSDFSAVFEQINKLDTMELPIIDSIIDNELVYKFVNTKHFYSILSRCQSKIQLFKAFKSLEDHNQKNAICILANVCLGIPAQFAVPHNVDQIIQWLHNSLA